MVKMAKLAGVAHNIAHRSASGLSCLSPHMVQALRAAGKETTAIELLAECGAICGYLAASDACNWWRETVGSV